MQKRLLSIKAILIITIQHARIGSGIKTRKGLTHVDYLYKRMSPFVKTSLLLCLCCFNISYTVCAQIGFGQSNQVSVGRSTPDPAAQLDVYSVNKGFLVPRLTTDQVQNMTTLAEGLIVYNTSTHKPCYYDGTRWLYFDNSSVFALKIGDSFGGGIVVYVDNSGVHGLIAATIDQGGLNSTPWGCNGTSVTTGTLLGTGEANTYAIIVSCSAAGIAARLCSDLVLNGYSDWYLPSKDEAAYVCAANTYLNLSSGLYYTSSQVNSTNAWYFGLSPCVFVGGNRNKDFQMTVRAIRSF